MRKLDPYGAFVDRVDKPVGGDGALAGVRVAVKDNIAVSGLKWTAGLPLLAERIAKADASCVAALRHAGAAIAGTVATDAAGFGMMTPDVLNPISGDRTAGGSSGGSAAAVAGGLADLALGTDTAGSVRVPAACCGLYGLKPTFGRVAVDGITPLSRTFDHAGLLAADLGILERATRVLLPGASEPLSLVRRIGFDPQRLAGSEATIRTSVERALSWLAAQGFTLVEVELPDRIELAEMHGAIVCAEALDVWRAHWPRDAGRFADTARRTLAYAATRPAEVLVQARDMLPFARVSIARAFEEADAIVGPTIAVPPPRIDARTVPFCGFDAPVVFALLAETCPFNVSGNPALSLPLPWLGDGGIPVSLQIATRHDRECDALDLAHTLTALGSAS